MHRSLSLRVFLASPGDLKPERIVSFQVVAELNEILLDQGYSVDLRGWEDTLPGAGRPQAKINSDVDACDLFIGIVWKRWGQPTGTHDSGFHEELERALDRCESTGRPEVWVFFKDVDEDARADPGPQLRKVMEFQEQAEKERRFLYGTLSETGDWEKTLRNRLSRFLFSRVLRPAAEIEGTLAPRRPSGASERPETPLPDARRVSALLDVVAERGIGGVLPMPPEDRKFLVARLHLISSALSDVAMGDDELRTHDLNALVRYRSGAGLFDPRERMAILRSVLRETGVDPGFALLWRDEIKVWRSALLFLGTTTDDDRLIPRIIDYLADLGVAPGEATAFRDRCLAHESATIADAAINWIRRSGTADDVSVLLGSGLYNDSRRRDAVVTAAVNAIGRSGVSAAYDLALDHTAVVEEDVLGSLVAQGLRLSDAQITRSVSHESATLRLVALRQSRAAGTLSDEEVVSRKQDPDSAVRRLAFEEAIERGIDVEPKEIEEAFDDGLLRPSVDRQDLLRKLMQTKSPSELVEYVRVLGSAGPPAYRELGLRSDDSVNPSADLRDVAAGLRERLLDIERTRSQTFFDLLMGEHEDLISHVVERYARAALDVLAARGSASDLSVIDPLLDSDDAVTRYKALLVFETLGSEQHVERVLRLVSDKKDAVARKAVCAALSLSEHPMAVVQTLGEEAQPLVLRTVMALLADKRPSDAREIAERRLSHSDAAVRKTAVATIAQVCTENQQARILERYVETSPYYYNVTTLLDRLLFAPSVLRDGFRADLMRSIESERDQSPPTW